MTISFTSSISLISNQITCSDLPSFRDEKHRYIIKIIYSRQLYTYTADKNSILFEKKKENN